MNSLISDILFYWLMPIFWWMAIVALSGDLGSAENSRQMLQWLLSWFLALDPNQLYTINFWVRKTAHIFSYAILFFMWFQALYQHLQASRGYAVLLSLLLCLGTGIIDEWHQTFIQSRRGSMADILLDLCGSGLMACITLLDWFPRSRADDGCYSKTRLF